MLSSFRKPHNGLALIMMTWLLAGLTLLVMSQVRSIRTELPGIQTFSQFTRFGATADGAIRLMAAELLLIPPPSLPPHKLIELEGMKLDVVAYPSSAFVDLNQAPPELLRDLLIHGAGKTASEATKLTDAIVMWRDPEGATFPGGVTSAEDRPNRHERLYGFESVSDLIQVPGIDLAILEHLIDLVTVHSGLDGIDPRFAPEPLLKVITRGDERRARQILDARNANDPVLDIADLPHAWIAHAHQRHYRIVVTWHTSEKTLKRSRWISLERVQHTGQPWRELAADPVKVE